ncbi:D-alanyl-D-alanine carboxypeptidase/D-alanyl-D-alanine-endopeptidase [Brevibacillus ruminantium]|uniref:D-alanyl-D-alanine carboxypeptidase/D-alanyl-D-alanine-endopeptidase n=1 Tax=Brevibacillus ruminantium TaxID=2950604 RepID=A0ABY4WL48_9BACL|nr:D-alanyl-D-alanine carboxypeptidase/D-alanyl-D-alanine-endopeptidase [Brevibacillus ruminantium]USG67394.1 D-alanyl-D-alanine carboxypeptidase/D-alanyl-D-alanine-endopeptidase [Brevibacillus ruminantium]
MSNSLNNAWDHLHRIISEVEQTGASIGVLVKSLDRAVDQSILFSHDADRLFTPASNTKILTVLTALLQMGGEFRYQTEISYTGDFRDGVLIGDLYIKGLGDPSLHTGPPLQAHEGVSIEQMVQAIKQEGLREICGNIVADASYFDDQRFGVSWAWDYESEYYSAQISALSLNRGTVHVESRPGDNVGDDVQIQISPETSYVQIVSQAKTVSAEEANTIHIRRKREANVIYVTGNLPMTVTDSQFITVNDPAMYAGTVLKETMINAGIAFVEGSKVVAGSAPKEAKKLASCESAPLKEIVKHLNKVSDNQYAEMLLKTMGALLKGEGSATAGIQVVRETLEELGVTGLYVLQDGSGLSPDNLVSPRQLVQVLESMMTQAEYENLLLSFPIGGVDGTLESRMKEEPLFRRVRAKTGSLNAVSSISGYMTLLSGENVIFSIMGNHYPGDNDYLKEQEDKILLALAEISDQNTK